MPSRREGRARYDAPSNAMPIAVHRPGDAPLAGRFVVEREVGRGGVGVVYRAHDRVTDGPVALKVLGGGALEAGGGPRFAREGRVLAGLDHPHVVRLVAWGGLDDGAPYVAMEWLEGEDLAERTRRAPLATSQALEVVRQIAEALVAAHAAGIVHRDIKPSNIFLVAGAASEPFAKLVDFGVAADLDVRVTQTGAVVGTPAYMAPEQARGEATVDARADLYALGATLFELIAGRPPHVGATPIATLARLVTTAAPRLAEVALDVSPELDDLVARLLDMQPDKRPASASVLLEELARLPSVADRPSAVRTSSAGEALGAGSLAGKRFVTSVVALRVGSGAARALLIDDLRARGADAVPLGVDSVVAQFGARRATGDEGSRALEAGRALAALGARVGVATGRTAVDLSRPTGEVVDRAAALANAADAGAVLADAPTSDLARSRFALQPRGDGSCVVGEALALPRADRADGAPFVGRDAELAQLLGVYERSLDDGAPIVVTVSGPPGIGKSRLRREVVARLIERSDAPVTALVRCEAFGRGRALGVAIDVLRALVGLGKAAAPEAIRAAVDRALGVAQGGDAGAAVTTAVVPRQDAASALLARLLGNEPLGDGSDARGVRDALWLAMTELLLRVVAQRPTVLVVEDMQWADAESLAWLDHALARAQGRAWVLLALVRPSFFDEHGGRFAGRDHLRLDLRPVARRASRAIARSVLGASADEALLERIAARAAGSPLFAEELARLASRGRDTEATPTIEAAIQASLDALDESARDAVARFAVLGLSGWDTALGALGVAAPGDALRNLASADLVLEQAESRFAGAREWLWKHALLRDVAYASLSEPARRELHARAARWLGAAGEDAATVAQHFDLAGEPREAAVHWERAARHALATNALADAVRMADATLVWADDAATIFRRALLLDDAWTRLDARAAERDTAVRALERAVHDDASDVRACGARARYDDARGAGDRIEERLSSVRERAAGLGLVDEEARCVAALASRYAFGGAWEKAEQASERLLELECRSQASGAGVDAWQTRAVVRQTRGELAAALDARRNAALAAARANLKEREATLTINVGFALTTIGAKAEARAAIEAGIGIANSIGSAGAVRHGCMVLLGFAATFGSDDALDVQLADARAEADAAAAGHWVTPDRATLGVLFYRASELMARSGGAADPRARALLERVAEHYRATGNHDVLPAALGLWAEAERRAGDAGRARTIAAEAADLLERGAPSLLNEAQVYLALHDACVDTGDLRGARDALVRALPPLVRRVRGLVGTAHVRTFVTRMPCNVALLSVAEAFDLLPVELAELLASAT